MQSIKIVSIVSAVTLVALALVGASPAMATNTALCAVNENPCSSENQVKSLHLVNVWTEKNISMIFWEASVVTPLCLNVLMNLEVLKPGSPQLLNATELTVTGCGYKSNHNECEFEVPPLEEGGALPTFALLKSEENLGILTAESGKVSLSCWDWLVSCFYNLKGMEFSMHGATGSNHGMITAEEIPLTVAEGSSSMCNEKATLSVLLEPLTDVYITS